MMALWNRPRALGVAMRYMTLKAAGGFARDGDIGRIAAEGRDIALHPLQRQDLVEQAVVSRDVSP